VLPALQDLTKLAESEVFDLVLLDLNVSPPPGSDSLRLFQRRWPDRPLILVAAEAPVEDRVRALNAGADDFVAKPFAVAQLLARVRAVLRRRTRPERDVLHFDDLVVNRVSHQVCRAGRLIEEVWRMHFDSITNVVDVYINYLRRKVDSGSDRPLIRAVRGVGYLSGGNHVPR
jgi:DNA-binding response OmpR family regulator